MLLLLSSLPFPRSRMQFLVIALRGELFMILQTWRNMLVTFPHSSAPGREILLAECAVLQATKGSLQCHVEKSRPS